MKFKRIISSLLAVLMLMSAFAVVISAEETGAEYTYNTTNTKPTIDYLTGQSIVEKKNEDKVTYEPSGTKIIYNSEDKLETMDLRFEKDGYQLYVDAYSGEVATRCIATGEVLFSNPYNVADSKAENSIKSEIMSQLTVKFTDIATGDENVYNSYEWAATRGQIVVRNIKNGIRVEYTIGREEARMLVPRQIEKTAFEKKIRDVMQEAVAGDKNTEFQLKKLMAYYLLQDPSQVSGSYKTEMEKNYPITKKMAIYILDSSAAQSEMAKIEQMIKTYCPDYTYEELDEDHMLTEYEAEDKNPPLFKMALEYTLDAGGMTVRLPANGIRFNEALYQLYSVEILPYMGAGANSTDAKSVFAHNSGYTFFPDGSGALFDFEKITDLGASTTVTGKVYGEDYAYHNVTLKHQEIIRYPVFGIVKTEDDALIKYREEQALAAADSTTADTTTTTTTTTTEEVLPTPDYNSAGFVAIVEEGDALMELSTYHAVRTSEYNTVKMTVYPRPQDTYTIADAISVGQNDEWTVVSSRKYTGNYKIKYVMLTDAETAAEKQITDYYDCSYTGMAKAYREYLENEEILTRLTADDVKEDIPLYIEAFGALQTTERFLSIPVEVMTPLTTFDDIEAMYAELSSDGVSNVNFILNGFTKGGISGKQVPYNLKWEGSVSDKVDFEQLLEDAKRDGYGIYPDFDFAYAQTNTMFDGLTLKDHAVKTIDDRYTTKREYSATKQTWVSYFDMAISPAYYSHFYEKLTGKYLEYNPIGISVSTLGSALNSDFDEDEPFNREDSKNFTVKAFEYLDEQFADAKIMTSGGNAYSWKYVDYITDIALDSSRYSQSSASVPFLGMVLHGYVEIAGTAVNMEGNIDYAILKAIENGASLKFILSYRNTNNLKNWEDLSKYYSVRYDIWYDDLVDIYSEVNELLADVQTSTIDEHRFIEGVRVPDDDELINDAKNAIDAAISGEADYRDDVTQAEKDAYRNARLELVKLYDEIMDSVAADGNYTTKLAAMEEKLAAVKALDTDFDAAVVTLQSATGSGIADAKLLVSGLADQYVTALKELDVAAKEYVEVAIELLNNRDLVTGEYINLVNDDTELDDAQKTKLQGYANEIKELAVIKDITSESVVTTANEKIAAAVKHVTDKFTPLDGDGENKFSGEQSLLIRIPAFEAYELPKQEVEEDLVAPEKAETPVYESDANKIVYEVYENGTAFLLNFNNYKVKVEIEVDGVLKSYTIDAYGYIVLKRGN